MTWRFDHLAFNASNGSDLQTMFAQLLGLSPGHRPAFPFPGRWLYHQDQAFVHVLEAQREEALSHIAFRGEEDGSLVLQRVRDSGLPHQVAQVPEDGLWQIFVQLPNGLVLELDVPAGADLPISHDYASAQGAPTPIKRDA